MILLKNMVGILKSNHFEEGVIHVSYYKCIGIKAAEDYDKLQAFINEQQLSVDIEDTPLRLENMLEAEYCLTDRTGGYELVDNEGNIVIITEDDVYELACEFNEHEYIYDTELTEDISDHFMRSKGWYIRP